MLACAADEEIVKPNILFIVADDLGWDDVSFHGSDQILTPNIDVLAWQGVILQQYYTDTSGTASRSALFTGKYPLRLGTQSTSIKAAEDRGIPISERLLPSYLSELGYETHLIGKWHVGKSREHYLPTNRGFDTFYGFLGDSVDYFTYNLIENWNKSSFYGLDLFNGTEPLEDVTGHLTDIFTERAVQIIRDHNASRPLYLHVSHAAPHAGGGLVNLQPPVDTIAANDHIAHSARRLYAGLVTNMDKSIGEIVTALAEREMLEDTLIVFVSDNGAATTGPSQNFGSNLPLRGMKNTPWEGGARSTAVMWHAELTPGVSQGLFHVTDWLPTLVTAAGGYVYKSIDGINQWESITKGRPSERKDVLVTIDDLKGWAAFIEGDYKIIVGELDEALCGYYGMELTDLRLDAPPYENFLLNCQTNRALKDNLNLYLDVDEAFEKRNETNLLMKMIPIQHEELCIPDKGKGCLYNITRDPLESHDLWYSEPEMVKRMSLRLRTLWAELKPRREPKPDVRANPSLRNYIWLPWARDDELIAEPNNYFPTFPLQVSLGELQYIVDLNLNSLKETIFESVQSMRNSFVRSVGGLFSF